MRNRYYDVVKGVAMFLVVLGHAIQATREDYEVSMLWIVMFHMPLFMLVSGKFFYYSCGKVNQIAPFIRKKFMRLYLPSLFWGSFNVVLIGGFKLLKHEEIDVGYFLQLFFTGMWFLTVLFILSVLGILINRIKKRRLYWGGGFLSMPLYWYFPLYGWDMS